MRNYARQNDMDSDLREKTNRINVEYVETILKRSEVYDHKVLGITDKLSLGGYYICGAIVFFMLLWGISCNSFLMKKDYSLEKLLASRGQTARSQVKGETIAYFTVTFCTLLLFSVIAGAFLQDINTDIIELDRSLLIDYVMFVVKITPVILMLCAFHKMIHELINDVVGVLLFQFLFAIITGYVCGCFYPDYFFPETLQHMGAALPTGIAFGYMKQCMSDSVSGMVWLGVVFYTVLFMTLTIALRKRRMAGDGA